MIESLVEMEPAFTIMQRNSSGDAGNILDAYYNQLGANIETLPSISEDYALIEQYAKNTHGYSHEQYELEILQVNTAV